MNGLLSINDSNYLYHKKIKYLIVIEGPTASGKTGLSIELAKRFNTCVFSADSRQFYKEISIGTAKPSSEEQAGIPHFFIDSHTLSDEVTAAQYEIEALELLDKEFQTKDAIILTGGSGMFIDALCIGLDPIPSSPELRKKVNDEFLSLGLEPLLEELKSKDPVYFELVDKHNPMRIIRAIEVIRLTNKTFTEFRVASPKQRPFEVHRFVINHPREKLYNRINLRVDEMMESGLLDEVKSVVQFRSLASLNTVGYKELFYYIDGNCTIETAVDKIKQNTRNYAKRQLTWFKKHPNTIWIDYTDVNEMAELIQNKFNSNCI
ncbi:MAG: tRNA (adenosine(37)-N6)-dimethylallyltransferase MiaA [Crocinitomicaceae bacterium]